MSHSDVSEEYSSPNQFFFYLYDKRNVSLRLELFIYLLNFFFLLINASSFVHCIIFTSLD